MADPTLDELRQTLIRGQQLAMQGSYMRRAPAAPAVPHLLEARTGLRRFIASHPTDVEAWRLLSIAEECLLNYRGALDCLQRVFDTSGTRDRRDLKRMVSLRQHEAEWSALSLGPDELGALREHLAEVLDVQPCDHGTRHTREWLESRKIAKPARVLKALRNRGGFCDCEILANAT